MWFEALSWNSRTFVKWINYPVLEKAKKEKQQITHKCMEEVKYMKHIVPRASKWEKKINWEPTYSAEHVIIFVDSLKRKGPLYQIKEDIFYIVNY